MTVLGVFFFFSSLSYFVQVVAVMISVLSLRLHLFSTALRLLFVSFSFIILFFLDSPGMTLLLCRFVRYLSRVLFFFVSLSLFKCACMTCVQQSFTCI
jgi:hypothetical protein